MTSTTIITQKGLVTLPKVMRLLDLAGKVKPRKNLDKSPLEARKAFHRLNTNRVEPSQILKNL